MEITVTLVGADEIIEKLEKIKKLLDEINRVDIQLEINSETVAKTICSTIRDTFSKVQ